MIVLNIFSGFCATFVMTGFSYMLARIRDDNFRQPELLNTLLFERKKLVYSKRHNLAGWTIHFLIGVGMISLLNALWYFDIVSPSYFNAMVIGIGAGALGVLGWHLIFRSSAIDPPVVLKHFYLQLVVAHIIFTITGLALYKLWLL